MRAQWNTVADALRQRAPKLAAMMDGAREDVLAYTHFPIEHWPQIASTNPLERLNKMGYPGQQACGGFLAIAA